MILGGLNPDLGWRFGAFVLSAALHAAAGLALLQLDNTTVPVTGVAAEEAGGVIMVELAPVRRTDAWSGHVPAHRESLPSEHPSNPEPSTSDESRRPAGVAEAAGSTDRRQLLAGSEPQGDHREMNDRSDSEVLAYRQRLENHLARYRVYPTSARTAARQGVVTVHFTMTREGSVLEAWVAKSSGASDLDSEALAAVMRAQPLPGYPPDWPAPLDVSLPVAFRLE